MDEVNHKNPQGKNYSIFKKWYIVISFSCIKLNKYLNHYKNIIDFMYYVYMYVYIIYVCI